MDAPRDYLKQLRTEAGMSMQDMGNALGISKQYYSLIEAGSSQKNMDLTLVRKIAALFDKPMTWVADQEQALWQQGDGSQQVPTQTP